MKIFTTVPPELYKCQLLRNIYTIFIVSKLQISHAHKLEFRIMKFLLLCIGLILAGRPRGPREKRHIGRRAPPVDTRTDNGPIGYMDEFEVGCSEI